MYDDNGSKKNASAADGRENSSGSPTIERVAEARLPTEMGDFRLLGYRSTTSDEEFVVIARGEFRPDAPAFARIHSQCLTGDVFGSTKCDCGQQLHQAMRLIADAGCGAIVYQQQEGRGIGIINKIRAYSLQDAGADTIEANERLGLPADLRRYEQCVEILLDLGLRQVKPITNNPEKIEAMRRGGLVVRRHVPLRIKLHKSLLRYLHTKRDQMGHLINFSEEAYERTTGCGGRSF